MRLHLRAILLPLFMVALSFISIDSFSQTVKTDKLDYPPGSTVIITGTGFNPLESVRLQVIHDLVNGDNEVSGAHAPWYVDADESGNIKATWIIPMDEDELGATLKLTADGVTSLKHAETFFADGPTVNQWADAPTYLNWQNTMNGGETRYFQGEVTPFVYSVTGLTTGQSYTISIRYDFFHSSQNAGGFAYITTYNLSRNPTPFTPSTNPLPDNTYGGTPINGIFYTVNANITSATAPVDIVNGSVTTRTVNVTYTANATNVDIYWGMLLSKRGTITGYGTAPTLGAGEWPGGSMQVTVSSVINGTNTSTNTSTNPSKNVFQGQISGMKYNDANNTGTKQSNEGGLQGWTIYLDQNDNGSLDAGESSTITDANGNYTFFDVFPNTYNVREVFKAGWAQTQPGPSASNKYVVVITAAVPNQGNKIFGNFTCTPPPVTFGGTLAAQCVSSTSYTLTGGSPSGGSYSGDGVTGTNFDASVAGVGVHPITYTFTDVNGCTNTDTKNIVVKALPSATIAYSGTPYCATGTASVSVSNVVGGPFTNTSYGSTTGLSIDASTGEINLATSTAGNYIVTYSFTGANGCSSTATTSVVVKALPSATIAYSGTPYCATGTASVSVSNVVGGPFTNTSYGSTTGLSIDASTGEINLATSTAGNYIVTYSFTGANGCSSTATTSVVVKALPSATIAYSGTPYCATGTASVSVSNVVGGPFTNTSYGSTTGLSIDASTGEINLATSTAGNYIVTYSFTGANGCSSTATTSVVVKALPSATIAYSGTPYCATGTASVSVSNVVGGPFTNTSYGSTTGLSIDASTGEINLATSTAGNYIVTYSFTGANGCSSTATTSVVVKALPSATIAYSGTPYCATGTASVSVSNVVGGPFTNTSYGSTTGLSIDASTGEINLATSTAGNYIVTYSFTGANGCSSTATTSVVVKALPSATIAYSGTPYCATGTASVSVSNVVGGPFTNTSYGSTTGLSIDASTGEINLATSTAGNYIVTYSFTGANGCSSTATTSVVVKALPSATIAYSGTPYCATGTASVSVSNVVGGPFTNTSYGSTTGLSIDASTGEINLATSTAGNYIVTYSFTGANGCSSTATTSVVVKALPSATIAYSGTPYCATGTASVSVSNVVGGPFTNTSYGSTTGLSIDASTGEINLATSTAGNYIVTYSFTGANGCSSTATTSVVVKALPSATIAYSGTPYCATGTASVSVSNVVGGPFTNTSYGSTTGLSIDASTGEINLATSTAGNYIVTYSFTGANGCSSTATTSVVVKALPSATIAYSGTPYCATGTASVSVSNVVGGPFTNTSYGSTTGLSIDASTGEINLATSTAGNYIVTYSFTGANGCSSTATTSVVVKALPSATIAYSGTPYCATGTASVSVSNVVGGPFTNTSYGSTTGLSIDASTGEINLATSTAGNYIVTYSFTGANGCSSTATTSVVVKALPSATIAYSGTPYCATGTASVSVSNVVGGPFTNTSYGSTTGLSIDASTGEINLATSTAGNYIVTYSFTGANGCSSTATTSVVVKALPSATIAYSGTPYCATGTASVSVSNVVGGPFTNTSYGSTTGLSIDASTGEINLATSTAGNYIVTYSFTGANGCSSTATTSVVVKALPSATIAYSGTPYCATGTASVSVSNVVGGPFTNTSYGSTTGLSIDASTGEINLATSTAGNYIVTYSFTGANGCSSTATTSVVVKALPSATIAYSGTPYCATGTASVSVSNVVGGPFTNTSYGSTTGLSIDASTGEINLATSTAGNYIVTYSFTGANGCSSTATTSVVVKALPSATIAYSGTPYCATGTASVSVSNVVGGPFTNTSYGSTTGLSIDASTGEINLATSTAGNYIVTYSFTGANGCSSTATTSVVVKALPSATIAYSGTPYCATGTASVSVSNVVGGPFTNTSYGSTTGLSIDASTGEINLATSTAGNYIVTYSFTGANGCSSTATTSVVVKALPSATIAYSGTPYCATGTASVSVSNVVGGPFTNTSYGSTTGLSIDASTGEINLATSTAGNYIVTYSFTGANGCSSTATTSVVVKALPSATIAYSGTPYCATGTASVSVSNVVGGPFTNTSYGSTTGLSIDASTGEINLATSTAGNYIVTYSFTGANGCSSTATTSVVVKALPSATIAYSGTPYCATGTASVSVSNVVGGPFTNTSYGSTTGLSIDASTGEINLATSTAGNYIVTYSFTGANGCSSTATTSVVVKALPSATIAYSGTPYCATGTASVSVSNVVGGPFTNTSYGSTTGLSIDASTGEINLATSTAGNYIVTYSFTGANGCSSTATTSVVVKALPSATIAYSGTPYCATGTASVSVSNVVGGPFTNTSYGSTTGLSIDASTGEINLATSTAGNYIVTYSFTGANGCSSTATTSVVVKALPSATIAYSGTPYCATGTASVSVSNVVGGPFTNTSYGSTTGLSIDASTGEINLATSTAGNYIVTYSFTGANGCSSTATTSVVVKALPSATIAYSGTPYCATGTASVSVSNVVGGPFTNTSYGSTTGLSIDASTGEINLATSTAGNYIVTYSFTGANGCSSTATTSVVVKALPSATIAYSGTPYCATGTASVSVSNVVGGPFTNTSYGSTTGLSIDASTGEINLATSTAGNYIVTYSFTGANGCSSTATTSVVVKALPSATIAYSGTPYCATGTASVSVSNVVGGPFTNTSYGSTTGLSIDASTGEINLATSTAGNYIVTYSFTGANGCSSTATTSVVVKALPSATIAYSGTPYCATGTASVSVSNVVGGPFTNTSYGSTTGLSIDASTGEINLATSTAGNYIVTYSFTGANGCSSTATTSVVVKALPSATIAYSGTPYCATGTASVSVSNVVGGPFTNTSYGSTTGLSIDASTGEINLATSTAGNYIVTYSFTGANGCSSTATTSVVVKALPIVTFDNALATQCVSSTSYILTGGQPNGGIYSGIGVSNGVFNAQTAGVGFKTITYTYLANNGCSNTATNTIYVTSTPVIPSPISISGTYSNSLSTDNSFVVTDDANGNLLTIVSGSVKWKKSSESTYNNLGLPANFSLTAGSCTSTSRTFILSSSKIELAVGTYNIQFKVTDGYCESIGYITLNVGQESACGSDFTGGILFINTTTAGVLPNNTKIPLTVKIAQSDDGSLGMLNATTMNVEFTVKNDNGYSIIIPATFVSSDGSTAIFTANWDGPFVGTKTISPLTSSNPSATFDVSWTVNGNYTNSSCPDGTEITISYPASDFTTGGGYILNDLSLGILGRNGGTVKKNNFGFNVKWNKSGSNLQGSFNTIIRKEKNLYQVKSNKPVYITSKVIGTYFQGGKTYNKYQTTITYYNAVIKSIGGGDCITIPNCSVGNGTINLIIEDNGEPGSSSTDFDRIGFTVRDGIGNVYYATKDYDDMKNSPTRYFTKDFQNQLIAGNIQVHIGSNFTNRVAPKDEVVTEVQPFGMRALPNPSTSTFNLVLTSNEKTNIQLRVMDMSGRTVQQFNNLSANQTLQIGSNYRPGLYIVEMIQGDNRKQIKLIKQAN